MARKVTKKLNNATVYAFNGDKELKIDEDGNVLHNFIFTMAGNPSELQAYNFACKLADTKNIAIDKIEIDVTTLDVDAQTFYDHSKLCEEGVSYGHDFITREFAIMTCKVMFTDEDKVRKIAEIIYPDATTQSKLLNYVREYTKDKMAIIMGKAEKKTERRYMTVEEYKSLAK